MRWLALLMLAGCYSPNPPSGAYLCSSMGSCPSNQSCVCGQCVRKPGDAACGFSVAVAPQAMGSVMEHQQFSVTINALQSDQTTPAAGYNGTVTLDFKVADGSRWCDVTPPTVMLQNGSATAMISLNRETVPPQAPKLVVSNPSGQTGQSEKITVTPPPFARDPTPIVGQLASFGWSKGYAAMPGVMRTVSGNYLMYFVGSKGPNMGSAIGVATSTDGKGFTAGDHPVLGRTDLPLGSTGLSSPSPFLGKNGVIGLAFGAQDPNDPRGLGGIGVATLPDGMADFTVANGNMVALNPAACPNFCNGGVGFASVIADPASTLDGGVGQWLMFFSGVHGVPIGDAGIAFATAGIGLASSTDGVSFAAEPEPVLSGDLGGESILADPQVIVEGHVYKMWYSFSRTLNPADLCSGGVAVGYATSTDGRYWYRSPTNLSAPALAAGGGPGWEAGAGGFLVGAVLPADPSNPQAGYWLYYSLLRNVGGCVPLAIGRATRP